jgi:hypothetical protein
MEFAPFASERWFVVRDVEVVFPVPEKVQVVVTQFTPAPVKVNAPAEELIEVTPPPPPPPPVETPVHDSELE